MYYIRTADKLMRTARWVEQLDGGIEVHCICSREVSAILTIIRPQRLKKILLNDELGICADLEHDMDELVGTYYDEWKIVTEDPERQKQFRQFVNTVCSPGPPLFLNLVLM
jgi:nitrite reductase (NAD(P)H)